MAGREEMLHRIRLALGRSPGVPIPPHSGEFPPLGPVMPPINSDNLLSKFEAELLNVAGSAYRAADRSELYRVLRTILRDSASVVLSQNSLLSRLGLKDELRGWGLEVAVWPTSATDAAVVTPGFRQQCFQAEAGITGVDFALAETGSLVLSSATEGSQLASLAPPVHIALYRRNQVVASLEEVLEKVPLARCPEAENPGRSIVFITGTSRTADIEQILVRGVHGPREVHAILVEEPCLAEAKS